jgi:hypothetical protein
LLGHSRYVMSGVDDDNFKTQIHLFLNRRLLFNLY